VNVPVGFLGMALAWRFIDTVRAPISEPLDRIGFALSGLGLSALVFGLALLGKSLAGASIAVALIIFGFLFCGLYVRHARRAQNPILDLSLLKIATFRAGVIGGFFFRIGIGATPFLLPLMLQLGFGKTPFQSGMITFTAAAGSLLMKMSAAPILRHYGFRSVLIVNALISAGFLAITAFFTDATPAAAIMTFLLVGGFFRSLEFTAINAISYADVTQEKMSRATSFVCVAQQLSRSTGVAIGALLLESSLHWRGAQQVATADFAVAFLAVAAIASLSTFVFVGLPASAGAALTAGRDKRRIPMETAAQSSREGAAAP
jgi:MFS family permease